MTKTRNRSTKKPKVNTKQPMFVPLPSAQLFTASDVARMIGVSESTAKNLIKSDPRTMKTSALKSAQYRISKMDLIELLREKNINVNRRLWRKRLNIGWVNWRVNKLVSSYDDWLLSTIVDAGFQLATGNVDGLVVWASSIAGDDIVALARLAEQVFARTVVVIPHGYADGDFLQTAWFRSVGEDEWHANPDVLSGWVRFEV